MAEQDILNPTTNQNTHSSANNITLTPATLAMHKILQISAIQQPIKQLLIQNPPNYRQWRTLFTVAVGKYNLLSHINGTPPPTQPDDNWTTLDFTVRSWIYATISDEILQLVLHEEQSAISISLYVDDIVLTASSSHLLNRVIADLSKEFAMTDLGPLHYFLGISVKRSSAGLHLSQSQYAADLLARAGMSNCNPCATPVDTNPKLSNVTGDPVPDPTEYRSLAGALQYLTLTRPDLSYAVQQACLHMHDPRLPHLTAVRRILRYVKGTQQLGLTITPSPTNQLTAYSDADWAGCPDTRRSTSGFCLYLGSNLVSWSAKRQHVVSRSSAEAEYRAVANAVAESCWIRMLLAELHCPIQQSTVVYCDNVSAVYLSTNPVQHQRTKHIEIDIHFVRDKVSLGQVRVLHVPSTSQFADIFTKGLPSALFKDFRTSLCLREAPPTTAGGC